MRILRGILLALVVLAIVIAAANVPAIGAIVLWPGEQIAQAWFGIDSCAEPPCLDHELVARGATVLIYVPLVLIALAAYRRGRGRARVVGLGAALGKRSFALMLGFVAMIPVALFMSGFFFAWRLLADGDVGRWLLSAGGVFYGVETLLTGGKLTTFNIGSFQDSSERVHDLRAQVPWIWLIACMLWTIFVSMRARRTLDRD